MKGIKAKVDDGKKAKVAKKTTRRQTNKSTKVEDVYQYIRKDKEGTIYLKDSVIKEFDNYNLKSKDIDNELMLFTLKKENH